MAVSRGGRRAGVPIPIRRVRVCVSCMCRKPWDYGPLWGVLVGVFRFVSFGEWRCCIDGAERVTDCAVRQTMSACFQWLLRGDGT